MDKKSRILKEKAMKKCVALISFLMFLPVWYRHRRSIRLNRYRLSMWVTDVFLFRDLKTGKTLERSHRIIDGYHSAYIQAEIKDGFLQRQVWRV